MGNSDKKKKPDERKYIKPSPIEKYKNKVVMPAGENLEKGKEGNKK